MSGCDPEDESDVTWFSISVSLAPSSSLIIVSGNARYHRTSQRCEQPQIAASGACRSPASPPNGRSIMPRPIDCSRPPTRRPSLSVSQKRTAAIRTLRFLSIAAAMAEQCDAKTATFGRRGQRTSHLRHVTETALRTPLAAALYTDSSQNQRAN